MKTKKILCFTGVLLCATITVNAQQDWHLAGNNNATNASRLGTTNQVPLRVITNGAVRIYVAPSAAGNVGIGTQSPTYKLHVVGGNNGIFGSGNNYGVRGSGGTYGLYGTGTYGVFGSGTYGTYGSGSSYGAVGIGGTYGVYGSGSSYGVYGNTSSGYGVAGISSSSYGLYGSSGSSWGSVAYGVYGAYGSGTTGYGVEGVSSSSYGVYGHSGYLGVYGVGDTYGTYGSGSSYGAVGSGGTYGVYGSGSSYGVYGYSGGGNGLYAYSSTSNGIWAYSNSSGSTNGVYAGVFESKVWSYGGYFESSDKNLKKNINDVGNAMNIINQLKPKNYEFRDDGDLAALQLPKGKHYGLLAQDLETVLPDLVNDGPKRPAISAASVKQPGNDGKASSLAQGQQTANLAPEQKEIKSYKGINYIELIPLLIKGMQEQDATIQKQQAQIDQLKNMLTATKGSVASDAVSVTGAWLKQNSPNPFTQSTTIQFALPTSAKDAQLLVYDQSGRLVKSVPVGSGQNQVSIAKGSLPNGNYIYTLMVDGKKVDSKNMIIAK